MLGDGKGLLGPTGAPGNDDPSRYSAGAVVGPGFPGHPREDYALGGGFPHMGNLRAAEDHHFPSDAYGNLLFQPHMLDDTADAHNDLTFPDLSRLAIGDGGAFPSEMTPSFPFSHVIAPGAVPGGAPVRPPGLASLISESPLRSSSPAGSVSSRGSSHSDFSDILVSSDSTRASNVVSIGLVHSEDPSLLQIPASPVTVAGQPATGSSASGYRLSNHAGSLYESSFAAAATKLQPYMRSFAVSLSPVPVPKYIRKAVEEEGCPFCVNTQLIPGSPCVALTCIEHGCHHGAHVECVSAPFWIHRLNASHPPMSTCVKATPSPRSCVLPPPDLMPGIAGKCYFELSIHHLLSNGRLLHLQTHDAASLYNPDTRTSFLHFLADTADELTPLHGAGHLPHLSPATSAGVSIPSAQSRFAISRARMSCMVKSHATGEQWRFASCFDLGSVVPDTMPEGLQPFPAGPSPSAMGGHLSPVQLVFEDPVSGHKLALRLTPIRVAMPDDGNGGSGNSDWHDGASSTGEESETILYAVSMVRYEFWSSSATRPLVRPIVESAAGLSEPGSPPSSMRESEGGHDSDAYPPSPFTGQGYGYGHHPNMYGSGRGSVPPSPPPPAGYPQSGRGGGRGHPVAPLSATSMSFVPTDGYGMGGGNPYGSYGTAGGGVGGQGGGVDVSRRGRGKNNNWGAAQPARTHYQSSDSRSDGYASGVWADSEGSDLDSDSGWRSGSEAGSVVHGAPPSNFGGPRGGYEGGGRNQHGGGYGHDGGHRGGGGGGGYSSSGSGGGSSKFPGSLFSMTGRMGDVAKTQAGSKFLQHQLTAGGPEAVQYILDNVVVDLPDVIEDMFGNYFVQALFRACNERQRERILQELEAKLADIACDRNGTYALQSIVDQVSTDADGQIESLRRGLMPHALRVINHDHGTHVVQRFQKRFTPAQADFIHAVAKAHCMKLATSPNGVAVLILCIDSGSRKIRMSLITEVVQNALTLSKHPYGNYVVQHLLGKRNRGLRLSTFPALMEDPDLNPSSPEDSKGEMTLAAVLCRKMRGHFVSLAMHKYSSNVVEKCALWAGAERKALIDELFFSPSLPTLLQDSYANYVVQTALQSAHPRERRRLVQQVRPHLAVFRGPGTTPAVYAKWSAILDRLIESATDGESSMSGADDAGSEFSDSEWERSSMQRHVSGSFDSGSESSYGRYMQPTPPLHAGPQHSGLVSPMGGGSMSNPRPSHSGGGGGGHRRGGGGGGGGGGGQFGHHGGGHSGGHGGHGGYGGGHHGGGHTHPTPPPPPMPQHGGFYYVAPGSGGFAPPPSGAGFSVSATGPGARGNFGFVAPPGHGHGPVGVGYRGGMQGGAMGDVPSPHPFPAPSAGGGMPYGFPPRL